MGYLCSKRLWASTQAQRTFSSLHIPPSASTLGEAAVKLCTCGKERAYVHGDSIFSWCGAPTRIVPLRAFFKAFLETGTVRCGCRN